MDYDSYILLLYCVAIIIIFYLFQLVVLKLFKMLFQ